MFENQSFKNIPAKLLAKKLSRFYKYSYFLIFTMDIQRSLEHSDASHDDIDLGTQPFDESEIRYVEGEDPVKEMMRLTNNLYIKFPGGFARTLSQTKKGLPDDIAQKKGHDLAVKNKGPTTNTGKKKP